jgi:DNA-binding LacI/PurR family transcriptional regulator
VRPSIKQVAIEAGVSTATVSRLLNKPATVSSDTADKINRAIEALGFRPNFSGRTLRGGRSRTVGVVVPTLSNTVFAQCLQGIELAARELDYAVMFTATEYRRQDEAAAVQLLLAHCVDGIILTVADADASPTLDVLDRENIPYVLAYNQPRQSGRSSVSVDNCAAAYDAVAPLIALGHTRIQMLAGDFHASDRATQRYEGYLQAMRQHGLLPMLPIEIPRHTSLPPDYLSAFRDTSQRPGALFCSNDLLALSAMRDLRALGLHVPDDVSVIGFDGIPLGELMDPMLASAVQPSEAIGELALRTLVKRIENDGAGDSGNLHSPHQLSQPPSQLLPHTIRSGGSVKNVLNFL